MSGGIIVKIADVDIFPLTQIEKIIGGDIEIRQMKNRPTDDGTVLSYFLSHISRFSFHLLAER